MATLALGVLHTDVEHQEQVSGILRALSVFATDYYSIGSSYPCIGELCTLGLQHGD